MWLEPSFIVRWVACALLLAGMTGPAVAAKVYRCGNVFQDQPCTSDKDSEMRPPSKSAASRETTPSQPAPKSTSPVAATATNTRLSLDVPRSVAIEPRR